MSYFCESCFKLGHSNEEFQSHKKDKYDYFVPIDLKCPEHNLYPTGLFCINEKELCCAFCHYKNMHRNHKLIEIDDEETLKKENISIEDSLKDLDINIQKLTNIKNNIANEITEINKAYDKVDKETTESFELKRKKLEKEENDLKEKLKTEVTKIKEQLEINSSRSK